MIRSPTPADMASESHASALDARATLPSTDIVETAAAAGTFKTLLAAAQAAGRVETLEGEGPFTIFAPTDEAFDALPEGTVKSLLEPANRDRSLAILTYHVVPGRMMAADVLTRTSLKTIEGRSVRVQVKDGQPMIDEANIVRTDIVASSDVIHVIDKVLLPPMTAAVPSKH
ncbi:MAG: fasciclin domain-containing protein [Candidatus Palauibacterales bacterium]|nr:fasciclin domain-containing protein [Candidatus Palauibacterales bacterium]